MAESVYAAPIRTYAESLGWVHDRLMEMRDMAAAIGPAAVLHHADLETAVSRLAGTYTDVLSVGASPES